MSDDDAVICVSDDEDNPEDEDDEDWNEREILTRVLELSKLDTGKTGHGETDQQSADLKKALELSLQCEPSINPHQAETQEVLELSDDDDDEVVALPGTSSNPTSTFINQQRSKGESAASSYDYIGDVFTDLADIENRSEEDTAEDWKDTTVDWKDRIEQTQKDNSGAEILGDSDSDIEEISQGPPSDSIIEIEEIPATGDKLEEEPDDLESVVITHINPPAVPPEEAERSTFTGLESKFGGSITVTQISSSRDSSKMVNIPQQVQEDKTVPAPVSEDHLFDEEYEEAESQMTTEEVSTRMRNVFESSLRLHLAGEEMEACNAVSTPLFPHQRVALAWMVSHEKTETEGMLGGILADDMGLGKTLTVLALILTNHWDGRPLAVQQAGYSRSSFSCQRVPYKTFKRKLEDTKKTDAQRKKREAAARELTSSSSSEDEFDQMTKDDSLSEKLNQSSSLFARRKNPLKDIVFDCTDSESDNERRRPVEDNEESDDDDDVASMIPQDLDSLLNVDGMMDGEGSDSETELDGGTKRRHTNPSSVIFYSDSEVSEGRSRSVSPVKINAQTGLKLIRPPRVAAVRRGRRRASLVVCPTSLISQWVEQLETHSHRNVNIQLKVHHGGGKAVTGTELELQDIVITTYGTLAAEWDQSDLSPLLRAKWLRVVLDEGHMIKNHNAKCAKAAMELDTLRKWVVTGTPIQNNLMELWSLVNWLGFGVYAGRQQLGLFKDQIELPCKRGSLLGFERLQVLVDAVCLRRTKTDKTPSGSPLVCLPAKQIVTRRLELSREERRCYQVYHDKAREVITTYRRRGDLLRNYAHVFALMTRLRQLCCHRDLVKEVDWSRALRDEASLLMESQEESQADRVARLREIIGSGVSDDCSLCLSDLSLPVITPCAHVFCRVCIQTFLLTYRPSHCPLCQQQIKKTQLVEPISERHRASKAFLADLEDIQVEESSSKVNAVLRELLRIRRDRPGEKIVVVSQFTSFLSILQPLIRERLPGVRLTRLDGSMTHINRSSSLRAFQSGRATSPQILLLSLKAGGVGLNLTAANHLMLLDPAWNPASEWQCFDRIHRLGQTREVFIYKFITKQSVEEKMLDIQDKKQGLISGAFHVQQEEKRRRRVDDIINIFSL